MTALIGTDSRAIADDVWAKLLWAGLNLVADDFPASSAGSYYPVELVRAVTLTWLFAGLRSDEIARLRVGCIRWQHDGTPVRSDATDVLADDTVCLLDVPVHKTGTAFTKPVDPLLGQAIEAWHALRPSQPKSVDRKTAEQVHVLFSVRAHPVARHHFRQAQRRAEKVGRMPPRRSPPTDNHDRKCGARTTPTLRFEVSRLASLTAAGELAATSAGQVTVSG